MRNWIGIEIKSQCIISENILDRELIDEITKLTKLKEGEYIVTYERESNGKIINVRCSLKQLNQSEMQNTLSRSMRMEEVELQSHILKDLTETILRNSAVQKPNLERIIAACTVIRNTSKRIEELVITELGKSSNNG